MTTIARLAGMEQTIVAALAATTVPKISAVELATRAGLTPDPWQVEALTSQAPRMLFNCSRQSGKSSVSAILAVHQALTEPGSLVLLLSPTLRQSGELFKKCVAAYRAAERPVPPESETALSLTLTNGSRIVSLPGQEQTVRGYSGVALLIIDEASRVPDDLYVSVRPMLAVSGGRLLALSTPFTTRGWWYEAWRSPEPWQRFEVPATMCPRISPTFLDEEQRTLGAFWFDAEYMCRFLDSESQAFRREDVDRAFDSEVEAWSL
jgi:hypothetical protein